MEMTPPPDIDTLLTVMCLAGGAVVVSAVGLAMLGPEKPTTDRKTIRRGPLPVKGPFPVAPPRPIKPTPQTERCYGSARRLVEIQKQWKIAHASGPAQPTPPTSSAADDVFVHWFENCVDVPPVKSPNDVISYEDLLKSYLEYCSDNNAPELSDEDFVTILITYSTSQGCKFDQNTGDLTHGRLKS
jgi:hypothetical protein